MYTRTITNAPDKLIKNGLPVFGTFSTTPELLDIKGVKRPFASIPLPAIFTNAFIRSNIACIFNTGQFLCSVDFFKTALFGFVEIVFWDAETRKKNAYRALIVPWRRFIPHNLQKSMAASFNGKRKLRISWDRKRNLFSFVCALKGDGIRPHIKGAFTTRFNEPACGEVTCVLPSPVMRRCKAVHKISASVKGAFTFIKGGKTDTKDTRTFDDGVLFFDMSRAYYRIHTVSEFAYGVGKLDSRTVTFSLVSSTVDAVNTDEYNENFLFVDDAMTPLPPVKITYPFGITQKWIIQDTESMVDLSFDAHTNHSRTHSLFILSTQYNVLFGFFNGVLLTKSGEQIVLKDFPGIVKKHVLRL